MKQSNESNSEDQTTNPPNVRIYTEDKTTPQSFLSFLVAATILTFFVGFTTILFVILPLSCLIFPFFFIPFTILLWSSTFWTHPTLLWKGFIENGVFAHVRKYFKFSYLYEEKLDPKVNYMLCHYPHGVFPLGPLVAATYVTKIFPGIKVYGISADLTFRVPLYRHIFTWLGAQPATQSNFKKLLSMGSCGVVIGGLAEMYMQHSDHEEILLNTRKGFVRVAVETGSPLVPVYYFGNSRVLNFGPRFLQSFSRQIRFSFGVIYGRFFSPLPHPYPIYMVIGKPLPVPRLAQDHPDFGKTVDDIHKEFSLRLSQLYDRHKESFGWKNIPLEIK